MLRGHILSTSNFKDSFFWGGRWFSENCWCYFGEKVVLSSTSHGVGHVNIDAILYLVRSLETCDKSAEWREKSGDRKRRDINKEREREREREASASQPTYIDGSKCKLFSDRRNAEWFTVTPSFWPQRRVKPWQELFFLTSRPPAFSSCWLLGHQASPWLTHIIHHSIMYAHKWKSICILSMLLTATVGKHLLVNICMCNIFKHV